MTTADFLIELGQANLAAGAAIVAVLALRGPARRLFGARIAYGLWLLAPLAAAASLMPARTVSVELPAQAQGWTPDLASLPIASPAPALPDPWALGLALWVAGAVLAAAYFAWRQGRFLAEARDGGVGPAVVGLIRPRIVLPRDFEQRFAADEQHIVLAHETAHLKSHDARINALLALAQCLCWFNPLVHVAAIALRTDQELACDAVVLSRHPTARRTYAEALVKTQLAATPLPLGCYWPAASEHPLTERIAMMKLPSPTRAQRYAGAGLVALLSLGAGVGAWAAQPAKMVLVQSPAAAGPAVQAQGRARADAEDARLAAAEARRAALEANRQGREQARAGRQQALEQGREARAEAIEKALGEIRSMPQAAELSAEDKARVEAALAAAAEAMRKVEFQSFAIGPQVEAAMAQARAVTFAAQDATRRAPLTPADEAALAKSREDLAKAREDMRKAQQELTAASAAMARAQSELMRQQMQRGCAGETKDQGGFCLLRPGAALRFGPGGAQGLTFSEFFTKDGPRAFGDGRLFEKNGELKFDFPKEGGPLFLPGTGRVLDCDREENGRVIRCRPTTEEKKG